MAPSAAGAEPAATDTVGAATTPVPTVVTPSTVTAQTDRVPTVLSPSVEGVPAALTKSNESVPTVLTPSTERIPAVLPPSNSSVPTVPTESIPTVVTPPTESVAAVLKPQIARVPSVLAPQTDNGQAVLPTSTGSVVAVPTPATEDVQTVVTPPTDSVPTGETSRVNVSSDVLAAAVTAKDVFQADTQNVTNTPSVEGEGIRPVPLSSSADTTGPAQQVSVPRPMTSQVLVAMAQNLSVIKEQSSGSLTLRLDPPELGEMEVQFRQGAQGVELRLSARVPVTLQMLLSRGDEISRVLSGLDIDISKVEIAGEDSFRGGGESAAFEHRSSQHSNSEQQEQDTSSDLESDDNDRRQTPGGTRQRRQVRTRTGIRA